jgi:hypothetical protein
MTSSTTSSTSKPTRTRAATSSPHSWELDTWPSEVWPHGTKRAGWIARAYRKELIEAGALTRIGKKLVFLGAGYTRWQERRAQHVVEFTSNNSALGKRRGHADSAA